MKYILSVLYILCCQIGISQAVFQFVPEIHGRNTDGLLAVRINSLLQEKEQVRLFVKVTEKRAGTVLEIRTPVFEIFPGNNVLNSRVLSGTNIMFAENRLSAMVRQNSYFPEGEYEYCFELSSNQDHFSTPIADQCFTYLVEPLTPLMLIEPYDRGSVCDKRPLFTWQPSLPVIPGMMYRLVLTEIRNNQTATEAIHYNVPLINQFPISSPLAIFPPSARELEEGKKYAWQVTAYKSDMILTRSEIWEFTISCSDSAAEDEFDGYRSIEDLVKGNFYVANGHVLFAIRNPYEARKLKYSVICLNKPDINISKLPEVQLKRGDNNINLDFTENKSFVDGYTYILIVELADRSVQKLRFQYKNPK